MKTDQQIVAACNALARRFYAMLGYQVDEHFLFYEARHPQERGVWNMAVMAYEHIAGTDVEEALEALTE